MIYVKLVISLYLFTTVHRFCMCRYTLKNSSGMVVQVIDLGATITSILVPDKHGKFDDVTAGFDTLAGQ